MTYCLSPGPSQEASLEWFHNSMDGCLELSQAHSLVPKATLSSRIKPPRTTQSPRSWQIPCLSSCVGWASPTQLPTAHSATQPLNKSHAAHLPPGPPTSPQHNRLRTHHFLHLKPPFHSNCTFHPPALTHSQPARVPKAALKDLGEHEPPGGVCSTPSAGSARTGGWRHCVPMRTVLWGILTQDLQGHRGHWPHSFLSLVCPAHPLLYPLPMPGYQDPPSTSRPAPQSGTETSMEGAQNLGWSWRSSPQEGSDLVTWPMGTGQPREGCAFGSSGSSRPDAGPQVLFHRKGRGDNPFLGNHLSDVTWES